MMKRLGALVGVVILGLLVGCGPIEQEGPGSEEPALSQEQLAALLSEVPTPDESLMLAACQPTTTNSCVNAGYSSCGNWSTTYNCGDAPVCTYDAAPSCYKRLCNPERPSDCEMIPYSSRFQGRNKYRVCFNSTGASCTEYERTNIEYCDCPAEI